MLKNYLYVFVGSGIVVLVTLEIANVIRYSTGKSDAR